MSIYEHKTFSCTRRNSFQPEYFDIVFDPIEGQRPMKWLISVDEHNPLTWANQLEKILNEVFAAGFIAAGGRVEKTEE